MAYPPAVVQSLRRTWRHPGCPSTCPARYSHTHDHAHETNGTQTKLDPSRPYLRVFTKLACVLLLARLKGSLSCLFASPPCFKTRCNVPSNVLISAVGERQQHGGGPQGKHFRSQAARRQKGPSQAGGRPRRCAASAFFQLMAICTTGTRLRLVCCSGPAWCCGQDRGNMAMILAHGRTWNMLL